MADLLDNSNGIGSESSSSASPVNPEYLADGVPEGMREINAGIVYQCLDFIGTGNPEVANINELSGKFLKFNTGASPEELAKRVQDAFNDIKLGNVTFKDKVNVNIGDLLARVRNIVTNGPDIPPSKKEQMKREGMDDEVLKKLKEKLIPKEYQQAQQPTHQHRLADAS